MNQTVRLRVSNEIPAYRTGLVSALDVGTSKIVCVIGRAEGDTLKVLGSALRESAGLKSSNSGDTTVVQGAYGARGPRITLSTTYGTISIQKSH